MPPEVEAALDKRTQMGVLGDLNRYTQFQAANAMEAAANNPGGAGEGVGLGVGMAMGQQMAQALARSRSSRSRRPAPPPRRAAAPVPPPLPQQAQWYIGVGGQQQGPYDAAGLGRRPGRAP